MHDRSPPRPGWLEVSRGRAFVTHLAVSATIVGSACAVIFFVWYPHPYFFATGAWTVLRVLIGVDVVLGPLLTLIVFKPGKRGLKLDLAVIAFVQLSAFVYGTTSIYRGRPYFTVFAVDRFYVLAREDGFVPLIARNRDLSFIVDVSSGAPLEVLDVDPWIGDAGARGAPAPAAQR